MNDNLSFCITLSTFAASIISSVYSMLENLPKDVLISLLLFSYAAFLIAQVFRYKTKGRASYTLWFIKVPPCTIIFSPMSLGSRIFITLNSAFFTTE